LGRGIEVLDVGLVIFFEVHFEIAQPVRNCEFALGQLLDLGVGLPQQRLHLGEFAANLLKIGAYRTVQFFQLLLCFARGHGGSPLLWIEN